MLTYRTEHRGALGLYCLVEAISTTGARLSRAAIHPVPEAEGARPALPVNVVADGRAAVGGRRGENMPYAPGQPAAAISPKTRHSRLWMNPRGEENLVSINVADPGHDMLVKKGRLDRSACPGQGPAKRAGVEAQGVRPQV